MVQDWFKVKQVWKYQIYMILSATGRSYLLGRENEWCYSVITFVIFWASSMFKIAASATSQIQMNIHVTAINWVNCFHLCINTSYLFRIIISSCTRILTTISGLRTTLSIFISYVLRLISWSVGVIGYQIMTFGHFLWHILNVRVHKSCL